MKKLQDAKVHTLITALDVARKYCAYQERSQKEVRNKLYELGLSKSEVEQAISLLIEENFINEERFAIAYARGKFRIKKWGKLKIIYGLKLRNITTYCINKAINEIDTDDYHSTLNSLITQAIDDCKERDQIKRNFSVAKKVTSRGYEPDLVWDVIKNLT